MQGHWICSLGLVIATCMVVSATGDIDRMRANESEYDSVEAYKYPEVPWSPGCVCMRWQVSHTITIWVYRSEISE